MKTIQPHEVHIWKDEAVELEIYHCHFDSVDIEWHGETKCTNCETKLIIEKE